MNKTRVVVVEDEFEVGLDIQSILTTAGYDVTGPLMTLDDALRAVEQDKFDIAVLDANLSGQNAGDVASALLKKQVPFVVVSGYAREFLPLAMSHAPLLLKPFDPARLLVAIQRLRR